MQKVKAVQEKDRELLGTDLLFFSIRSGLSVLISLLLFTPTDQSDDGYSRRLCAHLSFVFTESSYVPDSQPVNKSRGST